ncbi:MAG: hypothetical protein COB07_12135 [Sulfurovum sp.]|nr:MAG: hypothetical protein COB07_12135 [Sulfurovum sp.]
MNKFTLLYVEDDVELREQFVRVLKPKFKQIYEASDGLEALELYEAQKPHMMVIDINLPKLNGLDVVESIRKRDTQMPIVVLSAYSDQEKLLRAMPLGLSQYLVKPVPHKKLLTVLNEMAVNCQKSIEKRMCVALKNDYVWAKKEKLLLYHDEQIVLTKREKILISFLIENINTIVTFETIEYLIWEDKEDINTYSSLSHLLKRLRKKLPEELLESIYGEGYRIITR